MRYLLDVLATGAFLFLTFECWQHTSADEGWYAVLTIVAMGMAFYFMVDAVRLLTRRRGR